MAITHWPDDVAPQDTVTCIICNTQTSVAQATAGMRDINGIQAFACSIHLKERNLILGWTDYAISQHSQPSPKDIEGFFETNNEYLLH